ncbi:sensor histidine kinase [Ramlibacter albus]|uniref:histidine kinase n=1 Tax=Ramlibacter albus TaxID=2079448 RepID=A0A923S118_9BURK|nr:ATP-binding protein [Ramlibacter albus]MBC5763954.1 HAMP domain-containing protein [Ramlibacter albus]
MTSWSERWRFPLYLRIWLAVVVAVFLLTTGFGLILREQREREREAQREQSPPRQIILRDEAGEVLGEASVRPVRVPGQGVEFQVPMKDGKTVIVQLPPRPRAPGDEGRRRAGGPGPSPWWTPWSMLAIIALAVAVGSYPIVRRITKRLEALRQGVERWGEGDLGARVQVEGHDEIAFLAQRFNHSAERIETLLKTHKSLLANASHELRSPLARIRMGLELMTPEPDATTRREIERSIAELDQLVDEILLASRLDAKETDVGTFEAVDLTGLAAEECARAGAELHAAEDGRPLVVHGVPKLLRRALRNLLENARRYSTGPVTVELKREGGNAVVRVCDQGPGVPPAERDRIFEPFYRLPGASEREGSVGLGLALVRSITQRHHGSVHCEDNPGGGACFVLALACHEK